MYDGMQYDLIQGQGHESLKVGNPSIFKSYLLRHLQWELGHIIQIWSGRIFDICPSLCHVTLNLAETTVVIQESRLSVSHGANFSIEILQASL